MNKLLLVALPATSAIASSGSLLLSERQLIEVPCGDQGLKDCGDGCIPLSWTCCPSGAGGCDSTTYCNLGTNGEYNCCPRGEICGGPGGATTFRATDTVTIPGETSTIVVEATSTLEPVQPTEESTSEQEEQPPATTISTAEAPEPTTYTTTLEGTLVPSATPIPLPTPIDNGTSTETSSIAIVNAGASNGHFATNMLGGLVAGVAAFLF